MARPGLSVIVPVYQSTASLIELVDRTEASLAHSGPYEIIFVDDGSAHETWEVIRSLASGHSAVRGLRLGRNYGQHSALVAGVRQARYPLIVTLDDDLQNPPEEIGTLVNELLEGPWDVVYGVPMRVEQSLLRRLAGRWMRLALKGGLGTDSAPQMSSFRVFRSTLRAAFENDLGTGVSLDALLSWGTSRFGSVRVRHDPRKEGASNYTFRRLLRFAVDTTTGYSTLPLQGAGILGFVTMLFGIVILVVVTVRPLVSGDSVPGFPFLASTIAIFAGVQLLTLGVISEYLARMHFRVMRKPTYLVVGSTESVRSSEPARLHTDQSDVQSERPTGTS